MFIRSSLIRTLFSQRIKFIMLMMLSIHQLKIKIKTILSKSEELRLILLQVLQIWKANKLDRDKHPTHVGNRTLLPNKEVRVLYKDQQLLDKRTISKGKIFNQVVEVLISIKTIKLKPRLRLTTITTNAIHGTNQKFKLLFLTICRQVGIVQLLSMFRR